MSQRNPVEMHGEAKIPSGGILVIPNRLAFQDLLHVEKLLAGRKLVYLIDRRLDYDPLLQAHLEKEDTHGLEFTADENSLARFKTEIHEALAEDSVVLFIPGQSHTRPGQLLSIPAEILKFLTSAGAPILPLFVDHPEDTALGTERREEIEVVRPAKKDRLVIIKGELRGHTGTLIGIDGTDGIVKMTTNSDIKILDLKSCAKLADVLG